MNLNISTFAHPALAEEAQREVLAQIEKDYIEDKFRIKSVREFARDLYPTTHLPTQDAINDACAFSGYGFREYNILISGPSGTGKELIAQIIAHKQTLKSINMAGLTDSLFESQLFGYVPGAFTGGSSRGNRGFLQSVGEGVAFLDEIGEITLSQQAKLLRVLQERKVLPVGSNDPVDLRCRFIFATNRDLLGMVKAGTFREDLYFRINQIEIKTYSLKERGLSEVMHIARRMYLKDHGTALPDDFEITETFELGNVRALQNYLLAYALGRIRNSYNK